MLHWEESLVEMSDMHTNGAKKQVLLTTAQGSYGHRDSDSMYLDRFRPGSS